MRRSLISDEQLTDLTDVTFAVGNRECLASMGGTGARKPFDEEVMIFLDSLSKKLMNDREAKEYPDVITLGFWVRKSSVLKLKELFDRNNDSDIHVGRGIAFHIAPSNVPVNYAYSLVSGLLTGNINIVRMPSKDFPQIKIINRALNETLDEHENIRNYIFLVKYERNQKINDVFSSVADTRIVWGGDNTIAELRKSPLPPRAAEITFADRYSLAIINSDEYMKLESGEKKRFAEGFYNDTYLTDQNACTSPRMIIWTGLQKEKAKEFFWSLLHVLVKSKYMFQSIMGVNKLTSSYLLAAKNSGIKVEPHEDNYLVRVKVEFPDSELMDLKDNSGYFFEYDCDDILDIKEICDDLHCQTIGFFGNRDEILPLLDSGIRGVDRVVPIGKTMDFDLIWDGYNLYERLTRTIKISI